jgi:putative membrane protein insertion efficiency factor
LQSAEFPLPETASVHNQDESATPAATRHARSVPVLMLTSLIRGYQAMIRPLLIGTCKFCPTCSEYAIEALQLHGLRRGSWLAICRICRCHPFGPGGIDPVPKPPVPRDRCRAD